ncbi:MAG: hypothetical protein JST26_10740 [Bacteroidetes bacterium]|nr:hypothetical protein [Bacteroidota bacterium]
MKKQIKSGIILPLLIILMTCGSVQAQKVIVKFGGHPRGGYAYHGGYGHGFGYRPYYRPYRRYPYYNNVIIYKPYWRPGYTCYRRWIYFPQYNVYWDNRRNVYLFWNGNAWFAQPALPPAMVNININTAKTYELKPSDDDVDDVYKNNSEHQQEYPKQ